VIPAVVGGALIGAAGSALGGIWSAREAAKNREFQERMSSTAMTRQAVDLRNAGINPLLAGRMGGASSPGGAVGQAPDFAQGAAHGASTALAARLQRAQISLVEAQADQAGAQAGLSRTQAADISNTAAAGRLDLISIQRDLANQEFTRIQESWDSIIARAKAEVEQLVSSASGARARAALDQADLKRAENLQQLQEQLQKLGPIGPWVNVLLEYFQRHGVRP